MEKLRTSVTITVSPKCHNGDSPTRDPVKTVRKLQGCFVGKSCKLRVDLTIAPGIRMVNRLFQGESLCSLVFYRESTTFWGDTVVHSCKIFGCLHEQILAMFTSGAVRRLYGL